MRVYALVLMIAAVSTYLLVPLVLRVAIAVGAITQLRSRDVHNHPIPRLGGVAMYLGLVVSFVMASQIPYLGNVFARDSGAWAVLAGAGVMCLIGVLDDVWELTWYAKLAGEVIAAGVMAWFGVQFVSLPIFGLTVGSMRLTLFATIIVVVVVVNAVNFIDGLDGLAAGVVGIGALAFLFYAYYLTRLASPGDYSSVATGVVAGLVGICIGFLPHNFHEARIFMGDSGALMLGTVISGATILVTGQIDPAKVDTAFAVPAYMPIMLPVLVLIIPVVDMVWAVIRRVAQGKSPFEADAGHLHHRLLRRGHSHTAAVLVLYMWAGLVSLGSVATVVYPTRMWIPALVLAFVLAVVITRRNFGKRYIVKREREESLNEHRSGGEHRDIDSMSAR
ncbi:MAG: MraY family glycosyltransferase [Actinomycetaceae bacterium]|nr:undecaprenyl/decaprenyl-phosphate alpha-N-acetylglucosaminyl 1-phosphate transferase [Arcanobacterium sp.]MDD7504977.1 MraY family glycosyltransferase [Actinomycetaceae bacterium]MDY6143366.1 MraY family glycosyltransferase [Arcanobacterium sp.]